MALLPRGLVGLPQRWREALVGRNAARQRGGDAMNGAEVLLRCTGLTRRWGGLVAVSDVSSNCNAARCMR